MVRPRCQKTAERERQMQIALAGLSDKTYLSIDQAASALGVDRTTLRRRWNGGNSAQQAREATQHLSRQEELALAKWISISTATGHPVKHAFIRDMAEKIRQPHVVVAQVTEERRSLN